MRFLRIAPLVMLAICLPVFLISSNLRFIISEPYLYEYGFDKYNISKVTGISDDQLEKAAKDLRHYFNTGEESAQIQVIKDGKEFNLFNQRELHHLNDTKSLIQFFYILQWITLACIIGSIIGGFCIHKRSFTIKLMKGLLWGAGITLSFLTIIGTWALIDFDSLFLAFHHISFSNNLYYLDPSQDYLIMMFPEGFFIDASIILVGSTIIETVMLGVVSYVFLRRRNAIGEISHMWNNYLRNNLNMNFHR